MSKQRGFADQNRESRCAISRASFALVKTHGKLLGTFFTSTSISMCVYIYLYIYMYIICACIYTFLYIYIYIYIYIEKI